MTYLTVYRPRRATTSLFYCHLHRKCDSCCNSSEKVPSDAAAITSHRSLTVPSNHCSFQWAMFLPDTSTAEEPSPSPQSSLSLSNTTGLQQDLQCKSHSELSSIGIQNKHYTFPSTHNNSSTLSTHHTTVTSRTFIYSKVSLALRLHIPSK